MVLCCQCGHIESLDVIKEGNEMNEQEYKRQMVARCISSIFMSDGVMESAKRHNIVLSIDLATQCAIAAVEEILGEPVVYNKECSK